jgi:hypothetical protein
MAKAPTSARDQLPVLVYSVNPNAAGPAYATSKEIIDIIQKLNRDRTFQYFPFEKMVSEKAPVPPGVRRVPALYFPATGKVLEGKIAIIQHIAAPMETRTGTPGLNNNIPPSGAAGGGELSGSTMGEDDEGSDMFGQYGDGNLQPQLQPISDPGIRLPTVPGGGPPMMQQDQVGMVTGKMSEAEMNDRMAAMQSDFARARGPEVTRF